MPRQMKDSGIEWIGEIPAEWNIIRLKYLFQSGNGGLKIGPFGSAMKGKTLETGTYKIYNQAHLISNDFSMDRHFIDEKTYQELKSYEVLAGDMLFSMMGTIGKCRIMPEGFPKGIMDSHLLKARLNAKIFPSFFQYVYDKDNSPVVIDQLLFYSKGSIMNGLNSQIVKSITIPLPPIHEQQRISAYLDTQCTEIDRVLEKTRASIEEYKKLKQAVITQAVTKGVRGDRPMKDSGIGWIGDIPAEWEVRRIKTLFELRNERNYLPLEEVNLISLYTDKGVLQHDDIEKTTGNKASTADGYKKVYKDDIVVNIILCWMGAIGRSEYSGVTSPAYDIYAPTSCVDSKFYHHYFRTTGFNGECYKHGKGIMAMRWRTYSDQFRDIKVAVPPLTEQREILTYLDEKCSAIDTLIEKKQQFLTELENYKKSLIYECVTGKREVFQ